MMDFATLRQAAIDDLARLNGDQWTDFNAHDPGITILEQAAYALTDLGYRIGFPMPDLLASGGGDPYASLFPPEDVLTSRPVTRADVRRLVLDVPGVANAWVEAVTGDEATLHYDPARGELGMTLQGPGMEPVVLGGLSRVLIAGDAGFDGPAIGKDAARLLYRNRPLGEDYVAVRVLERQGVRVEAAVEIEAVDRPDQVLLAVLAALADTIAPPVPAVPYREAIAAGRRVEDVLEGPRLRRGYLDSTDLERRELRRELHVSDLVRAVMDVPAVRAVTRMAIGSDGDLQDWVLDLDPTRAPRLDVGASVIELTRSGLAAGVVVGDVAADFGRARPAHSIERATEPAVSRPAGRDRAVGSYLSFQQHLPAAFGVGELGVPQPASPERVGKVRQLQAYLLFLDQLLADLFAQLAHVPDLLGFHGDETATYFAQEVEDDGLGLDRVRDDGVAVSADSLGRKNRLLTHLLARFAEHFADRSLVTSGGADDPLHRLVQDKLAFLRNFPRVSAARGTAADDLAPPGPDNVSGLEQRVRLKMGLVWADGEDFVLVEHILLRPTEDDLTQGLPFLIKPARPDPFSFQLSFVFARAGRFTDARYCALAETTVREATPAHLVPYVRWLEPAAWRDFAAAHTAWRERRRRYLLERLGLQAAGG